MRNIKQPLSIATAIIGLSFLLLTGCWSKHEVRETTTTAPASATTT